MCLSTFSRRKYYSALYTFMCNTDLTVTTVIEWFPKTIPRSFRATNYLFSIVLVRRNTWGIRFSSENLIFEDRPHRWHSHGSIYWKFYLLELVRLINAHTGSMPFAKFSFALRPTLTKSVSGSYLKKFFSDLCSIDSDAGFDCLVAFSVLWVGKVTMKKSQGMALIFLQIIRSTQVQTLTYSAFI